MIRRLLVFLILLSACNQASTYTGEVIELDFSNVRTIENEDWIEINGSRYTHYNNYELAEQDSYSLLASKMRYYVQENEMNEPINPYSIGILLASHIDLNNANGDKSYVVSDSLRYMVHIAGKLVLESINSEPITVKTNQDYPVSITVRK